MTTTTTGAKELPEGSLIESMFKAGAHYGYSRSRRHPSYKPVIFGSKNKVDIVDLEKTAQYLEAASVFVRELGKQGKTILFVGTKNEARKALEKGALSVAMPFVVRRWIGGTLTNFTEIKRRVSHYVDLMSKKEKSELTMYTKMERLLIDREIESLAQNFSGIVGLEKMPAALFLVDPRHEKNALLEARELNIPVIALGSTDCNLKEIDYPIPANDSSVTSISFFIDALAKAYKEGKITS